VLRTLLLWLQAVPEMKYDPYGETPQGEILLRGPMVFAGYYKMADKTKESFGADAAADQTPCLLGRTGRAHMPNPGCAPARDAALQGFPDTPAAHTSCMRWWCYYACRRVRNCSQMRALSNMISAPSLT